MKMHIKYDINMPDDLAAGMHGFNDTVEVVVDSGDPGGETGDFALHMLSAMREWYDGAKIKADVYFR